MKPEQAKPEKQSDRKVAPTVVQKAEEQFPINIPESQGDVADQAELEIEASLQIEIERARHGNFNTKN